MKRKEEACNTIYSILSVCIKLSYNQGNTTEYIYINKIDASAINPNKILDYDVKMKILVCMLLDVNKLING